MADTRTLDILLRLKDEVSGKAGKIKTSFNKISEEITKLSGAASMVKDIGKAVYDFAKDAARLDQTRQTFGKLTAEIGGAEAVLRDLTAATKGMVDNTTLMEGANRLLMMGLADTSEQASKLTEMAVTLGSAMGMEAGAAIENFSLMLANTSIPRLDSYGISAGNVRNRINELMTASADMTREEAFMIAVMEEGEVALGKVGDISDTAAGQMAQLETTVTNLSDDLKLALVPAMNEVLSRVNDFIEGIKLARDAAEYYKDTMWLTQEVVNLLKAEFPETTTQIERWEGAVATGNMTAGQFTREIEALAREHEVNTDAVRESARMIVEQAEIMSTEAIPAAYDLASALSTIVAMQERVATATQFATSVLQAQGVIVPEGGIGGMETYQKVLEMNRKIRDSHVETIGSAGGAANQVTQMLADIERKREQMARKAALTNKYWYEDQYEFILDNADKLTEELQKQFAERTEAAKARADEVKEYDTKLAQTLLDAESWYQQERLRIEQMTDEEAKAQALEVLDREYNERVTRAEEMAALERQIQEENMQRQINAMKEGMRQGMVEAITELTAKDQVIKDAWGNIMDGVSQEASRGFGQMAAEAQGVFDPAIESAKNFKGTLEEVRQKALEVLRAMREAREELPGRGEIEHQYGGVVMAPIGQPVRRTVHGGEVIFNPFQGPPSAYNTTFNINMPAAMSNEQILELQRREAQRRAGWRG